MLNRYTWDIVGYRIYFTVIYIDTVVHCHLFVGGLGGMVVEDSPPKIGSFGQVTTLFYRRIRAY